MVRFLGILLVLPLFTACPPPAQVGAQINPVPRDSAQTCAGYCQSIGLPLDAVVIMANNVGCVCGAQPAAPGAPAAPAASMHGAAAAGGLSAILLQHQAAEADEARRRREAGNHTR